MKGRKNHAAGFGSIFPVRKGFARSGCSEYAEGAWAEDRATRRREPRADSGVKSGAGGGAAPPRTGIGPNVIDPFTVPAPNLLLTERRTLSHFLGTNTQWLLRMRIN